MGINKFVKQKARAVRFQEKSKNLGNKAMRKLEESLLKPEALPKVLCEEPPPEAKKPLAVRTVKFVFPDNETVARFKKYFPLSKYIEPSCIDNGPLIALLDALDEGRLIYDKKTKTLLPGKEVRKPVRSVRKSKTQSRDSKRSKKVGCRKQRK